MSKSKIKLAVFMSYNVEILLPHLYLPILPAKSDGVLVISYMIFFFFEVILIISLNAALPSIFSHLFVDHSSFRGRLTSPTFNRTSLIGLVTMSLISLYGPFIP